MQCPQTQAFLMKHENRHLRSLMSLYLHEYVYQASTKNVSKSYDSEESIHTIFFCVQASITNSIASYLLKHKYF